MRARDKYPAAVAAGPGGEIRDIPVLAAAGCSGNTVYPLDRAKLIPLPAGSRLLLLPGRQVVGFDGHAAARLDDESAVAVAAFLPPGYTVLSLSAFDRQTGAPPLPLNSYCAVCWYRGKFHVPAIRVDRNRKHDPCLFDRREVAGRVRRRLRASPGNRLLAHHGLVCALQYACPNAVNLFMDRWEAPVAVSGGCNAACRGCISSQRHGGPRPPQERIGFTPTVDEILELAVPHLEKAPEAMVSFGQGCEGEPLLRGRLIETAIREIRKRTGRGTIHINTNGSRPGIVERLIDAGLDSIRISLNSARESLYNAYYRNSSYSFRDVMESFRVAREGRLWVSVNLLTFPGVTDSAAEIKAFTAFLDSARPDMIQWRNLNIDPDSYMDLVNKVYPARSDSCIGISEMMRRLRTRFPAIRMGYLNPAVARHERD